MRMLPPAAALLLPSPLARIFPSTCSVPVLIRATPPPERQMAQVVPPPAEPAPPGVLGSSGEPYAGAIVPPVHRPPCPPWLPPEKFVAPLVRVGLSVVRS